MEMNTLPRGKCGGWRWCSTKVGGGTCTVFFRHGEEASRRRRRRRRSVACEKRGQERSLNTWNFFDNNTIN
jgi:hypothetical protein